MSMPGSGPPPGIFLSAHSPPGSPIRRMQLAMPQKFSPSAPASMNDFTTWQCGEWRHTKPTGTARSLASAVRWTRSASPRVRAIGFSTCTCSPRSHLVPSRRAEPGPEPDGNAHRVVQRVIPSPRHERSGGARPFTQHSAGETSPRHSPSRPRGRRLRRGPPPRRSPPPRRHATDSRPGSRPARGVR